MKPYIYESRCGCVVRVDSDCPRVVRACDSHTEMVLTLDDDPDGLKWASIASVTINALIHSRHPQFAAHHWLGDIPRAPSMKITHNFDQVTATAKHNTDGALAKLMEDHLKRFPPSVLPDDHSGDALPYLVKFPVDYSAEFVTDKPHQAYPRPFRRDARGNTPSTAHISHLEHGQ